MNVALVLTVKTRHLLQITGLLLPPDRSSLHREHCAKHFMVCFVVIKVTLSRFVGLFHLGLTDDITGLLANNRLALS